MDEWLTVNLTGDEVREEVEGGSRGAAGNVSICLPFHAWPDSTQQLVPNPRISMLDAEKDSIIAPRVFRDATSLVG